MCGYACIECGRCGKPVNKNRSAHWVCLSCGATNPAQSQKCLACGFELLPPGEVSPRNQAKAVSV